MNKKIVRSKEAEITKAGRMVFDAIFGDSQEFQRKLDEELDREAPDAGDAITAQGHSLVRCAGCAREQGVPPNVDVRTLERHGWRFADGAWRCQFCAAK